MACADMNTPPSAPSRQTTAPQLRSMLPPVSMHISMPVPRIYTYVFWLISSEKFAGLKIAPLVMAKKKIYTSTRTMSIAFLFRTAGMDLLFIGLLSFLYQRFCRLDITSNRTASSSTRPLTTF